MKPERRNKYHKTYLEMAQSWASLSHCKRKKVGALIVKDGMIISDGYNGTPSGFDNDCEDCDGNTKWEVMHGEANAILKVAKSNHSAEDADLYLTMSPCKDCCKLIVGSGIKRVIYLEQYRDIEGIPFLLDAGVEVYHFENEVLKPIAQYQKD